MRGRFRGLGRPLTREPCMPHYRISFAKEILGVPFPIGSVEVGRARSADRARRAGELRFARQYGLGDWRERADRADVEPTGERP